MHFKDDTVYIDDREPTVVKDAVKDYFESKAIPCRVTRMETGDFFYNGILVERKDCIDLVQSIKDARLNNQRLRMVKMAQKGDIHPYVIIQGTYNTAFKNLKHLPRVHIFTRKSWTSAIAHLEEMGIGVFNIEFRFKHDILPLVIDCLAKHKKDDKPLHEVFVEPQGLTWDMKAYQCIEGIGYTKAKDLAETITIRDLMRRPRDNAIEVLTTIKGIGTKRAENIYDTIVGSQKLEPLKEVL